MNSLDYLKNYYSTHDEDSRLLSRHGSVEFLTTMRYIQKYLKKGVCAVDLAGAEALFKTHTFDKEFELAKQKNIPFTIHCGEADGPESIKAALDFGAKRLGHGIHAIEDVELMKRIKREKTVYTGSAGRETQCI